MHIKHSYQCLIVTDCFSYRHRDITRYCSKIVDFLKHTCIWRPQLKWPNWISPTSFCIMHLAWFSLFNAIPACDTCTSTCSLSLFEPLVTTDEVRHILRMVPSNHFSPDPAPNGWSGNWLMINCASSLPFVQHLTRVLSSAWHSETCRRPTSIEEADTGCIWANFVSANL